MLMEYIDPEVFVGLREPRKEKAMQLIQTISNVDLETIIQRVAIIKGVPANLIKARGSKLHQRNARNIVVYLAWKGGRYTFEQIGKVLGGRDHSTIISAKDAIKDPIAVDKNFAAEIAEIERMVSTGNL